MYSEETSAFPNVTIKADTKQRDPEIITVELSLYPTSTLLLSMPRSFLIKKPRLNLQRFDEKKLQQIATPTPRSLPPLVDLERSRRSELKGLWLLLILFVVSFQIYSL